jgi:oligoendopeptidase F
VERLLKRNEVPVEHTWDLESIYPSNEAWEADFSRVTEMIPKLVSFQGKLNRGASTLLDCLRVRDEIFLRMEQVFVYTRLRKDQDVANDIYQGLEARASSLFARVRAAGAYLTPEILAIPADTLAEYLVAEPDLQLYQHELADLLREKAHVRSAEVEELLAQVTEVAGAPANIFGMLDNADMKFPTITDEEGNNVELTKGRFIRFLESPKRSVRESAFKALYSTYAKFRNTLGATHADSVKKDIFFARARKFSSARTAALSGNNIPESVYDNLVSTVHKNLPSLHRYLHLRKQLLRLDELHVYDLYTPMVAEVDKKVPYAEAVETILSALAPLGEEYCRIAREGLTTARWVDPYENEGKRSGAYSYGSYTTNPFILMNYQETLDSMFTLAHELGHSMHSYYSRKNQPYVYGHYTIFVAEVASTFNEALLTHYLLEHTDDKRLRMYLINHYLEQFRTTLYRQTMFAEFEHQTHQRVERNEALTPDSLSSLSYELNQQYYATEGMVVDQEVELEWARIPHFYSPFYVYQYATGLSAAVALSQQVLQEGHPAVERYLGFLKKGGSDYSVNILCDAGVDMSSPEPVQQALDVFSSLIDQLEALVG